MRWTPKIRPLVKFDFCRFAVDKKEQTYESKTETTQCGLQGQSVNRRGQTILLHNSVLRGPHSV
jgi:hypothetical protein